MLSCSGGLTHCVYQAGQVTLHIGIFINAWELNKEGHRHSVVCSPDVHCARKEAWAHLQHAVFLNLDADEQMRRRLCGRNCVAILTASATPQQDSDFMVKLYGQHGSSTPLQAGPQHRSAAVTRHRGPTDAHGSSMLPGI